MYSTVGFMTGHIVPRADWDHLGGSLFSAVGEAPPEGEGGPPRWSDAAALKLERPAGVGERGTFPGPERRNWGKPVNRTLGAACGNLAIS
jgi:hypothetical protein